MADAAHELHALLNTLGDSSSFVVSGSLAPVLPGLGVAGVGGIGIPVTPADAKRLVKAASQAPYGRGEETIVDTKVRRVWQIEAGQVSLRNAAWQPFLAGMVDAVRKEFGISRKIDCELYKLLVYEKGSFFAPHRDTEKTPGMFATLVVCLPSAHEGGTLIVSHDGQTKTIDFGGDEAEFKVQYAAFYADCRHEITPVTKGYRVCLVYNLAVAKTKRQPAALQTSPLVEKAAELLARIFTDKSRKLDKLVIPFAHEYSEAGLSPGDLKGADRSSADVLAQAAERLGYQAFLALLTHHQSGTPAYGTYTSNWSRRGRDYDDDDDDEEDDDDDDDASDAEMEEVFDEELQLEHFLDMQGRKQKFGTLELEEHEILSGADAPPRDYKQEIHEATGNSGATLERWYHAGAMVIWPPDRYFGILAGEGPAAAVPALRELLAKTKQPAQDESCRAFAEQIIARWRPAGYSPPGKASLPAQMLKVLEKLASVELVRRFLTDVLPKDFDGSEGKTLVKILAKLGWTVCSQPLVEFFTKQAVERHGFFRIGPLVSIFESLCTCPPKMQADRREACLAMAVSMENLVSEWDKLVAKDPWRCREENRHLLLEHLIHAYAALNEVERIDRYALHILNAPKQYALHETLIPAVHSIAKWIAPDSAAWSAYRQLRDHCVLQLQELTAQPVLPPADWSRGANLGCKCADCRELARFLRDPKQPVGRFSMRQDRRSHLESQMLNAQSDVACTTDRRGTPQTLVCTKTQASYERRLKQFEVDSRLLKELEKLRK